MSWEAILALSGCLFVAAVLYASVGHAGASGYLAPAVMRPTALILNVIVAAITTVKFFRAGHFSWSLFWPFALASILCAFLGGLLTLPAALYKPVVGGVLLVAAYRLLRGGDGAQPRDLRAPPLALSLATGAGIGLLSGLTGTGGGVFLRALGRVW